MLSIPVNNWTEFQLGNEEIRFTFNLLFTDVGWEWVNQAVHGLKMLIPFSVHGYCDPGRIICTVSYWNCYVVFEGEDRDEKCIATYSLHISMIDFCKKLYTDISDGLEEWARWDDGSLDETDDAEIEEVIDVRRNQLQELLGTLKKLIDEKEKEFSETKLFLCYNFDR